MKRLMVCLMLALAMIAAGTAGFAEDKLRDGVFQATTKPDHEGYYCRVVLTVSQGRIVKCEWEIRDARRDDRLFDETYGPEVFKGHALYIKQSEENLRGMKTYAPRLIEKQVLADVDAVTGATWARGKFQEALIAVLQKAKK